MNVNMGEDEDQPNSPGPEGDTQMEDKTDSSKLIYNFIASRAVTLILIVNLLPDEPAASEAAEAPSMPEGKPHFIILSRQ